MKAFKLPNSLTVLYDHMPSQSVTVQALVKVGSNHEPREIAGISHVLEHMLFEGTKKRTAHELTNEIEKYGGEFNAATSNEKTIYYITLPKQYVKIAITIMADILQNPLFDPAHIEKERNVIINEINMLNDDPKVYQWILFYQHLFQKHPARFPIYGSIPTVKNINQSKMASFFKAWYRPNNTILSITGDISSPMEQIKKEFRSWQQVSIPRHQHHQEPPMNKRTSHRYQLPYSHAYVVIGYKAPPRDNPESYPLDIIRAILSRGQSGRLFNEIRTKLGLAYVIGAHYDSNVDFGVFGVYVGTDPKNIGRIRSIILEQLKLKAITKKDLQEAKTFLQGSFQLAAESTKERADMNASWWMFKKRSEDYLRAIKKITLTDVKSAARKYLFAPYTEVVIQPPGK